MRSETMKLLEGNIGKKLLDTALGKDFWVWDQKHKCDASNKKDFCSAMKQQNENANYGIRENICKPCIC